MGHTQVNGFLFAGLLGGLGACASVTGEARPTIAFVHARVVPMDREVVLEDHTVLVRGDRIVDVGPASEVAVPGDALIVQCAGKFLVPGLADMHVHLEDYEDGLVLFVASGVTTVRNMWGGPHHLEWRRRIEAREILGPTIYTTGPITDGEPPLWEGSAVVTTPDEAEREALAQSEAGYDALKIMTNLRPEVFAALMRASKAHDFPVYGHVPTRVGFSDALRMGQRSFEHLLSLAYELLPEDSPVRPKLIEAYERKLPLQENMVTIAYEPYRAADLARLPTLAAEAAAAEAWFCPTLIATQGFHLDASSLDALQRQPWNRYVPDERLQAWTETLEFQISQFGDPEVDQLALEIDRSIVEALHRAGARLVAGTDTHPDMPFIVPGFALISELENLVDSGLSPFEALEAATSAPAALLGETGEFGVIAPGARADLVLVDQDPLTDVSALARRSGVMIRGRWLGEGELQAMLEALAAASGR